MKRVLAMLLAAVMLLSMFPASAFAEDIPEELPGEEYFEAVPEIIPEEFADEPVPELIPEDGSEDITDFLLDDVVVIEEEEEQPENSEPAEIQAQGILAPKTRLMVGETVQLSLSADTIGSAALWSSSDEAVLTVDDAGLVTAVSAGNAEVSAVILTDGGDSESYCLVITVVDDAETYAFAGLGTEAEPFGIDSEAALRQLAELVNSGDEAYAGADYVLAEDISFTGAWTPIGNAQHPFTGSFDGNGKKLVGLTSGGGERYFGLFGVTCGAELTGIALDNVNIQAVGYEAVGAIVGYMQCGSLSESYVTGMVNASGSANCGGLVGAAEGAEINSCFSTLEMKASGFAGGIVGSASDGTVLDCCYNIGFINSTGSGAFGSVIGNREGNVSVSACYCIDTTDKSASFLTRQEAANAASFFGFDFDRVWTVGASADYPYPVLRVSPCSPGAQWAPDTTEHSKGYYDDTQHNTPLSYNANRKANTFTASALPGTYVLPNLPAVRDQDPYGTCWAHAIMASAETNLIKKGYADPSINLSELQFTWYHHNGTLNSDGLYEDPLGNFGGDRNYSRSTKYGTWGGDNYYRASKTMTSWIGPIKEDESTSYSAANAQSIDNNGGLDYSYAFSKDAAHLENVRMIPANSGITAIKTALLTYGALSFSYCHDSSFMTGGNKYYYSSTDYATDHAVTIVGWDDTISKDMFYDSNSYSSPSSDGAWIIRNSWGSDWGNAGYFYMSYESPYVCAAGHDIFAYDFEPAGNYTDCYQYDGSACSRYYGTVSGTKPSIANVFTANGNDLISAVSLWLEDQADLSYNLKIYTGLADSNPTSGTLAAQLSGQTDYAGYYTIPLPNPISVAAGEKFSIVIEGTNKSKVYYSIDKYNHDDESDYFDAYSYAGQSFKSSDGSSWTDVSADNGGNYRIKAFTVDDLSDPTPSAPKVSLSVQAGVPTLSWNAVGYASSYTVYRSIFSDSGFALIGTTSSASFADTSAASGTVYYYKVKALSSGGKESKFSNVVSGLNGPQTSFIVTYNANGGSGAPEYQIKTKGSALTLSSQIPTRTDNTFLGWSSDSIAKKAEYQPGDSYTLDEDVTLYAVWLNGVLVSSPYELESAHSYDNNMDKRWYYTDSTAESMSLTFDSRTQTEAKYDFIYIYDGSGNQIGKYDGTTLADQTVEIPGDTVCIRLTSDVSYQYWGFKVTGYSAKLKPTPEDKFTITFVNYDGSVLQSSEVNYGSMPEYTEAEPTKAGDAQYSYKFSGWSPEISAVSGEATYTAQFTQTVNQYTIRYENHNGALLQSSEWDYGATPSYSGKTPTKASTEQYNYTFSGWSPAEAQVTGNATYVAQFTSSLRQYTVQFKNYNGTVLQSSAWNYGATPSYSGKTPTRASDSQYTYTFSGWSPQIVPVSGAAEYTAQYKTEAVPAKVTSLSINPSSVTMYKGGQQLKLSVTALPANASNACTWKSSNTLVAKVDANGVVTTRSLTGSATITATASDGSKKTAKCTVNVVKPVTGLTLTAAKSSMYAGGEVQLTTSITPSGAPGDIVWSFSCSDALRPYVTLSGGKLSVSSSMPAECAGAITVTATATGCSSPISKSVTINVLVPISSMTMYANGVPASSGELWAGENVQLSVAVLPAGISQAVTWKSSNTASATVDGSGKVTAAAGGSAVITATSAVDTSKSVSYTLNVKEWAKSVTVTAPAASVTKGSSLTPTATVLPSTASNKNVRWEISPASDTVSFDSSTGKITVSSSWNGSPSSVTLTAYALGAETDNVKGSVTVSIVSAPAVVSKATSVTLYTPAGKSASTVTIKLSQGTQKFTAKVNPTDASQTVTWSSSNTKVATVDQNGNVKPIKKGLVTIKVKTTDGSNKTDSILVTVSK